MPTTRRRLKGGDEVLIRPIAPGPKRPIMKLFRSFGDVHVTGHDHGVTELLIDLPDEGVPDALVQTVRAVARGDLIHHATDPR